MRTYFLYYEAFPDRIPKEYCENTPYRVYSRNEARRYTMESMAKMTAEQLTKDTWIPHFVEKEFGIQSWLVYKEG